MRPGLLRAPRTVDMEWQIARIPNTSLEKSDGQMPLYTGGDLETQFKHSIMTKNSSKMLEYLLSTASEKTRLAWSRDITSEAQ